MENLALRMRARHVEELRRSVEPYRFVPQGAEVTEIPAGYTAKIEDRIRRVALENEGAEPRVGPILGILCGFPSGRIRKLDRSRALKMLFAPRCREYRDKQTVGRVSGTQTPRRGS